MKSPMKKLSKFQLYTVGGTLAGAIAGFLYWKFVGCASGSCPITSNWMISTLYGGVMGGLSINLFQPESQKG